MKAPHYTSDILDAADSETVCWCSDVTKGAILKAKRNGAHSVDDIRRLTGACTVGRCRELSPRGRCCSMEIKLLLEAEPK